MSTDERNQEVFIHLVRKDDTVPRIALLYHIPAPVLRRANRIWATDAIVRDELLLPTTACAIQPPTVETTIPSRHKILYSVLVQGVGEVGVTSVPRQMLSYFPSSTQLPKPIEPAYVDTDTRDSFELIRDSAGKVMSTAYNSTTNLIRRMRERKEEDIDLIEL